MDFFEAQERARRRTGWLVVLFSLAVCGTVMAVYAVATVALHLLGLRPLTDLPTQFWYPDLFWRIAASTLILVVGVSIYKTRAVSASADAIALGLGGRLLDPNTVDPHERRLLNVVEEMAIASGVPVPTVHLLPQEPGINAFAVGLDASRSSIAVTDGCLRLLSRDELQGVVAHEFSHLLNGDARINVRLLGLVHGILVIGLIGSAILRSLGRSSGGSRRKGNVGGLSVVIFVGISLYLIGSIGVFFARLIKAAVSRQRELLADAAGAQFTRNPAGLAGALKKIGRFSRGSRILAPRAEEASHFYFSEGMARITALMSTHPSLPERIRILDPQFAGELPGGQLEPVALQEEEIPGVAAAVPVGHRISLRPAAAVASVGALGDQHIAYAQSLLAQVPQRLRDSIREPWVARAVVLALLLDGKAEIRTAQLSALLALGDANLAEEVSRVAGALRTCPVEARLPVLDLALPALRRLSSAQCGDLRAAVDRLIRADSRIGLFEYTLQRVLLRHLAAHFESRRPPERPQIEVREASSLLLSMLAHAGATDPGEAARAFEAARAELSPGRFQLTLLPRDDCGLRALDRALDRLVETAPRLRGEILGACVAAVARDGKVTIAEGEMLRAISDSLGCPMPPLLPGEHVQAMAKPAARTG